MSDKKLPIVPFQDVLADLLKWLKGYSVVIIGGVAVSLLGRPRHTQDIDALVLLDNTKWDGLLKSAKKFGFAPRIVNALKFAQKNRVLLIKHWVTEFAEVLEMPELWIDIKKLIS